MWYGGGKYGEGVVRRKGLGYGEKSKEDGGKEMGRRGIERMGMHGGGGRGRDEEGERECM